eukprot:TRINITY_DN33804_c0_g1_i1.p1 TRINITY_DN33804_c0_g1~~TRINITY_DN33804_c0_g1_i1.p1  ORF type:complete len:594 (-),score=60.58 TRINITY_DN33804_c0_g1_i1:303-2063(-)
MTATSNSAKSESKTIPPCSHDIVFGGLCAQCFAHVKEDDIPAVAGQHGHHRPGLLTASLDVRVSTATLQGIQANERTRRANAKRLVLVLDIDHTLLHTGSAQQAARAVRRRGAGSRSRCSVVTTPNGTRYYVRLRPHLPDFLRQARELCDLYLYTHGTGVYAEGIVREIDPDGRFFGSPPRLFTRDNTPLGLKNLREIFPADTSQVLVVDDRDEVWPPDIRNTQLIKVSPYLFFDGDHRRGASLEGCVAAWQPDKAGSSSANICEKSPAPASEQSCVVTAESEAGCGGSHGPSESGHQNVTSISSVVGRRESSAGGLEKRRRTDGEIKVDVSELGEEEGPKPVANLSAQIAPNRVPSENTSRQSVLTGRSATLQGEGTVDSVRASTVCDSGENTAGDMERGHSAGEMKVNASKQRKGDRESVADLDAQLPAVAEILRRVHRATFCNASEADPTVAKDDDIFPHVADILPALRQRTLEGCVVCFTGVSQPGTPPERHPLAWWCIQLGATVDEGVGEATTHLVAARRDTKKFVLAFQRHTAGLVPHVVHPGWVLRAAATWQRPLEADFAVVKEGAWPSFVDIWATSNS